MTGADSADWWHYGYRVLDNIRGGQGADGLREFDSHLHSADWEERYRGRYNDMTRRWAVMRNRYDQGYWRPDDWRIFDTFAGEFRQLGTEMMRRNQQGY